MDIQKNSSVNFGASRILSVSKGKNVTDIYKLNRNNANDVSFVKRCLDTMAKRPNSAKPSMKSFLKAFLECYIPYNKGDYYIGIKNDETITGGLMAHYNDYSRVYTGVGFNNDYNKLSKDCLIYSLLSETKRRYPNADIGNNLGSAATLREYYNDSMLLPSENIGGITKQIEAKYPEHVFCTLNEEVNLERIMGINNLEDRILL